MKGELNMEKIYRYCIQVEGELDRTWSEWLDGFSVRTQEDGLTLLVGEVVDQSALHGLLARLHRLGLTLQLVVLVNCFPSAAQVDSKSCQ
jgi:hypothetical protein